jgi:hypothetical protein
MRFGYFKAVPENPRSSWSARSPDGNTVVVTCWKEDVWEYRGRVIFDIRNHPQLRNGNADRRTMSGQLILFGHEIIAAVCSG